MSLGLWLSGVECGTHGLSNVEQFFGPDHHFSHHKGVVVFCKSVLFLWSNDFMVVSPHVLATIINSLQLKFSPDVTFAQFTGCPYPPLVLLTSSLYGYLICVWTCDAGSRGCIQIEVSHIFPWWVRVWWGLISSSLWASCSCPIIRVSSGPGWTGWGLTGSYPQCWVQPLVLIWV